MLKKQREVIDQIDNQIIKLLDQRFMLTDEIGKIKQQNNINIQNKNREDEILLYIEENSVNYQDISQIYQQIFLLSKNRQKKQ